MHAHKKHNTVGASEEGKVKHRMALKKEGLTFLGFRHTNMQWHNIRLLELIGLCITHPINWVGQILIDARRLFPTGTKADVTGMFCSPT